MPIDYFADEIEKVSAPKDYFAEEVGTVKPKSRKDVIDAFTGGEKLIPEQNWVARGLYKTGKDIATIPAHFVNQFAFNAPRSLAEKAGLDYPEAESGAGKLASGMAGIVGGIKNPIVKATVSAPTLLQKAIGSAVTGALYTPTEDPIALGQRARNAAINAAVPFAGRGAQKMASGFNAGKKDIASKLVNSLIKPLQKNLSYGKNPGMAVAQEGITAGNLDDLATKISEKRSEVGKAIGSVLKNNKTMVNMRGVLRPLDVELVRARKAPKVNAALISRLEDTRDDLRKIIGGKDLQMASANLAFKMKRQIGDLTKWTGNQSDDKAVNRALKMTYGRLAGRIENVAPEVKGLNQRYANLTSAEAATKYRSMVTQRQNMINITPAIEGGILGALLSGGQAIPAAIGSASLQTIMSAIKSPRIKTNVAAWLAKSTPQTRQNVFQKFPQLREALKRGVVSLPPRIMDELRVGSPDIGDQSN